MPNANYAVPKNNYDPRWFIWTIVFLVVTGVALTSYIFFSEDSSASYNNVTANKVIPKKVK
jgi:hypothetical protein